MLRKQQLRPTDFRRGRRLGANDHLVVWSRPQRPAWLDEETYRALPDQLELREVRLRVRQAGFRTRLIVVVTTLLDAAEYPAGELTDLYRARWDAELNLRSLKVVLGLDVLRCQSPALVRQEIWAQLLADNLSGRGQSTCARRWGKPAALAR